MRRRFNYTGRQKLLQKDVTLTITEDESGFDRFYIQLNLADYQLPEDGRVWVEAYDRNAIMRFPFGTVNSVASESDNALSIFAGNDSYYFRVKIVDPDNGSRLLASADSLSPLRQDDPDHPDGTTKSLLRVTTRDLGPVPWKLEFCESDYPLLVINHDIEAGKSLARTNQFFQALVFPNVLNQILRRILLEEKYRPDSEPDSNELWMEGWLEFAGSLPGNTRIGVGTDASEDEINNWIEDTIDSFCKKLNAVRKIRVELKEIE